MRRSKFGDLPIAAVVLTLIGCLCLPAGSVAAEAFILGADIDETKPYGKWYRKVYGEAFRRLGAPLQIITTPTERLTMLADRGEVDGQVARIFAYADAHPNQLRVDEAVLEVRLALFAAGPAATASDPVSDPVRLEDLAAGQWRVEYRRGVAICEKLLKPRLPADRLSDVTSVEQGLKKLKAGRTHLYCDFDTAVWNELASPAFKGESGIRQALDLNVGLPLYPYIHKKHAALVPKLAEVLRQMKAEGLFVRYSHELALDMKVSP